VTPVLTQDGRYLPEVTISKKDCRARPSTYSPAVFTKAGRRAWPSLPTLPGTDRTIGRQGPGVRTGRLGTLVGGRGLRAPQALELLKASIASLDQVYICIDALDELVVKYVPNLLRSLHNISKSCPGVRFLFTGRPHIKVEIEKYFPGAAQFLQVKGMRQDIMRFIEMMLDDDPNPEAMNAGLRAEITSRVSETISDVYVAAISVLGLRFR